VADRLTGLDSSFLHLEQGGAHMHVASTMVFEGPAPHYDDLLEHVRSRLHLVPRFRQRLRFVPFSQGRPVWVDDPHFNLRYHLRHTALPAPGSDEQLRILAARLFSQRLDRTKPLWEIWLVDGFAGDRFALVAKSHHALVDGVSGVDITTVLFDASPDPAPPVEREEWIPGPEPSDAQLLVQALLERATSPGELARGVRALVRGPRQVLDAVEEAAAAVGSFAGAGLAAPSSPFNVEIGPYRRFVWVQGDLAEFKQVKNRLGGTVNDVVLAAVSGALGRYLRGRGHSTAGLELRAMVPISVRAETERGALGNRVSAMMAPLPIWCEDPAERMKVVTETMGDLKKSRQAVGANLLTGLADFAPPTILGQASRLQARQRFFNLVVTNVPGPQFSLFLLGKRMEATYPMVPLARRQALCVGIMSYDGQVNFGLVGDYDAMPGLDSLGEDLAAEISALSTAEPRPKRRPRQPSAKPKPGQKARARARSGT
jgi:diacylglycerol O-acyltransferase